MEDNSYILYPLGRKRGFLTIFTKKNASTSDKQGGLLSREYNIHYRACVG